MKSDTLHRNVPIQPDALHHVAIVDSVLYFDGEIKDARVFDHALTEDEVRDMYENDSSDGGIS